MFSARLTKQQSKAIEVLIERKSLSEAAIALQVPQRMLIAWLANVDFRIALICADEKTKWETTGRFNQFEKHLINKLTVLWVGSLLRAARLFQNPEEDLERLLMLRALSDLDRRVSRLETLHGIRNAYPDPYTFGI